jgi:hypothetical protein
MGTARFSTNSSFFPLPTPPKRLRRPDGQTKTCPPSFGGLKGSVSSVFRYFPVEPRGIEAPFRQAQRNLAELLRGLEAISLLSGTITSVAAHRDFTLPFTSLSVVRGEAPSADFVPVRTHSAVFNWYSVQYKRGA